MENLVWPYSIRPSCGYGTSFEHTASALSVSQKAAEQRKGKILGQTLHSQNQDLLKLAAVAGASVTMLGHYPGEFRHFAAPGKTDIERQLRILDIYYNRSESRTTHTKDLMCAGKTTRFEAIRYWAQSEKILRTSFAEYLLTFVLINGMMKWLFLTQRCEDAKAQRRTRGSLHHWLLCIFALEISPSS